MKVKTNLLLIFLAVLFLVWPVPNTISIRETALAVSLFLATSLIYEKRLSFGRPAILKTPARLYGLFIAWAVIVALFVSPYTLWSLKEIKSEWLMGTLVLALGVEIALLAGGGVLDPKRVFMLMFLALAAHAVLISADGAYTAVRNLNAPDHSSELTFLTRSVKGLTKGPIEASVAADFLMTMLFAESFVRFVYKKAYLPVGRVLLAAGLALAAAASFFCGMRNIVEIAAAASIGVLVLLFSGNLRKNLPLAALLFFFLALVTAAFFKSDARWTDLKRSAELAWTTDYDWNQNAGSGYLIEPVKGEKVSLSNYLRFEIYRKGLGIIRTNPLGLGFGRDAFGHALSREYGNAAGMRAESAVLDIFIGTGLAGGALFVLLYASLVRTAAAYFRKYRDFLSVWLLLSLISFGSRMMVDSIMDHMLHQFMFITGLLIVLKAKERPVEIKSAESAPFIVRENVPQKKLA